MNELSAVEYNHLQKCYIAILSDGTEFPLSAETLREAEQEAQRVVDHGEQSMGEYTNFRSVRGWE